MQSRQATGFFIEVVIIVAILGTLSAIAIPNIGLLVNKGRVESREMELHDIQTAVVQMLSDSFHSCAA